MEIETLECCRANAHSLSLVFTGDSYTIQRTSLDRITSRNSIQHNEQTRLSMKIMSDYLSAISRDGRIPIASHEEYMGNVKSQKGLAYYTHRDGLTLYIRYPCKIYQRTDETDYIFDLFNGDRSVPPESIDKLIKFHDSFELDIQHPHVATLNLYSQALIDNVQNYMNTQNRRHHEEENKPYERFKERFGL